MADNFMSDVFQTAAAFTSELYRRYDLSWEGEMGRWHDDGGAVTDHLRPYYGPELILPCGPYVGGYARPRRSKSGGTA